MGAYQKNITLFKCADPNKIKFFQCNVYSNGSLAGRWRLVRASLVRGLVKDFNGWK